MPHPTDEFDKNTLPDPELNPLLNPLLAAHMGRWAEVYFTNPPEKRGQAVAELLRELQSASPPEPDPGPLLSAPINQDASTGKGLEIEMVETRDSPFTAPETVRSCGTCGYENLETQRFCGMCGASLLSPPQTQAPHVEEPVLAAADNWNESEPSLGSHFVEYTNPPATSSVEHDYIRETAGTLSQETLPHFAVEPEGTPYRYRLYVGVAMAILLAVLVYMGWRGTKALSSSASPQSALPAAIPTAQPAPAPSTQESTKQAVSSEAIPSTPVQSQKQGGAGSRTNQLPDSRPAAQIVTVVGNSSAVVNEPSSAEDLATAEKYLNGGAGVPRDSSQAAQWLWKAMRQGNATATMMLADLYLRGDGVPQSCDQARVLLDAAARKGSKAAAERLRHLQAFGCQ
ncbi:MAG: hypothetical protein ABSA78_11125 [Candidatus Sulfotelmatobacter sp.]